MPSNILTMRTSIGWPKRDKMTHMQMLRSAGKTDAGIGAIIAAFTAPAALLAGAVFKSYSESRP